MKKRPRILAVEGHRGQNRAKPDLDEVETLPDKGRDRRVRLPHDHLVAGTAVTFAEFLRLA